MTQTKDSGIEWIGEIPQAWSVKPLYAVGQPVKTKNTSGNNANLLSLSYGEIKEKDIESTDGLLPESFDTYQGIKPGDLVFRFTDLQNDKRSLRSAVSRFEGIITSAYLAFRPNSVDSRYLGYLMRFYDTTKVFYSMGTGLRQSLKYSDVRRMMILVPPLDEQKAVVDFLDRELNSIDLLIEKQNSLLELIAERKRAFVLEHLTRADATEGAQLMPLKYAATARAGGTPKSDSDDFWSDTGTPWVAIGDMSGRRWVRETSRKLTELGMREKNLPLGTPGTVLFAMYASVGEVAVLATTATWNQAILGLTAQREVTSPDFLYWTLWANRSRWREYVTSSTQENLNRESTLAAKFVFPSLRVQANAIQAIDAELQEFETLEAKAHRANALLNEKRSSLISAAVTGKIDIRGKN